MKIALGFVLSNAEFKQIKHKAFTAGLLEPAARLNLLSFRQIIGIKILSIPDFIEDIIPITEITNQDLRTMGLESLIDMKKMFILNVHANSIYDAKNNLASILAINSQNKLVKLNIPDNIALLETLDMSIKIMLKTYRQLDNSTESELELINNNGITKRIAFLINNNDLDKENTLARNIDIYYISGVGACITPKRYMNVLWSNIRDNNLILDNNLKLYSKPIALGRININQDDFDLFNNLIHVSKYFVYANNIYIIDEFAKTDTLKIPDNCLELIPNYQLGFSNFKEVIFNKNIKIIHYRFKSNTKTILVFDKNTLPSVAVRNLFGERVIEYYAKYAHNLVNGIKQTDEIYNAKTLYDVLKALKPLPAQIKITDANKTYFV